MISQVGYIGRFYVYRIATTWLTVKLNLSCALFMGKFKINFGPQRA